MKQSQNDRPFTLDIPQREGKEGYIGTIFSLYLRLGSILAEPTFRDSDPRIYFFTKFIIGLIPGKKNRAAIKEPMKKELEEVDKMSLSDEEKSKRRNDICIEYIGSIHDFVDLHIGVSEENKMSVTRRK